tara:strand:- start:237 stop:1385 length:1149 start_codon:yes stop_codon:yes gene_type:complete
MIVSNYEPSIGKKELLYLKKCIKSKWLSSTGPLVKEFEKKIVKFTGAKYAVALSSGTAALHLSLKLLNPKVGDEVLMPSLTFIATANSVIYNRCSPVFLDIDDKFNLDLNKLENFLVKKTYFKNGFTYNKKTKKKIIALINVAIWGSSANMYKLNKILASKNIYLIEDAAEALGSFIKRKKILKHIGTFGSSGCLSFNLNKIITTGGGGALLTNNKQFAIKAKYLSLQAKNNSVKWIHNDIGYNYGLSNLHAAIGLSQFTKINKFIKNKKLIHEKYQKEIEKYKKFEINKYPDFIKPNYWMNLLIIKKKSIDSKRLMKHFKKKGIEVKHVWLPCHKQKMFKKYQTFKLKNVNKLHKYCLLMPSSSSLALSNITTILKILRSF